MTPTTPARAWWMALRPRTLGASLVPVLVGTTFAWRTRGEVDVGVAALTALAALALQVATNLANDYYDHASGIDTEARLGPVRVVQAGLLRPESVQRAAFAAIAVALLAGTALVAHGGWPIVAIGASAAVAALAYSAGPAPLAALGCGEVLAFAYFGLFAVGGTAWLQGVRPSGALLLVAIPIALLVTAIMLVNNLRDIPTDRAAGKRTLAVLLGDASTRRL
ncbi:MAG: 1,4-dihydroxy-2-naphthoate octaprenyltransferase, partial [Alphaproteobacteria bacterium]